MSLIVIASCGLGTVTVGPIRFHDEPYARRPKLALIFLTSILSSGLLAHACFAALV